MQQKITAPADKIGAVDCAYCATFQRKGLFFYVSDVFPVFYSRRRLGSRQTSRQHTNPKTSGTADFLGGSATGCGIGGCTHAGGTIPRASGTRS